MKHVFIINGHKLEYKDALAKRVREVFKNEDYYLTNAQLKEFKLDQRNDWYYII